MFKYFAILIVTISAGFFAGGCGGDGENNPILLRANRFKAEGNYDKAAAEYDKLLKKFPESRAGLLAAGAFYRECVSDYERAIACYRRYLELENSPVAAAYLESVRAADYEQKSSRFKVKGANVSEARLAEILKANKDFESMHATLRAMISRQNRRMGELSVENTKLKQELDNSNARLAARDKLVALKNLAAKELEAKNRALEEKLDAMEKSKVAAPSPAESGTPEPPAAEENKGEQ